VHEAALRLTQRGVVLRGTALGLPRPSKLTLSRLDQGIIWNVSTVNIPAGVVLTNEERELIHSFDATCTTYELPGLKGADTYASMLADNKNWNAINLSGSDLTDIGLARFQESARLSKFDITKTGVTRSAAESFHAAQPGCNLITDFFTVPPISSRNPSQHDAINSSEKLPSEATP
jgi:hypothetical protein